MSQIILVDTDLTKDTVFSLNLNVYLGADVIVKKTSVEAIQLLQSHEFIDLIISKSSIDNEKTALEIYKYLKSHNREIPLVILGEELLIEKFTIQLPHDVEVKDLLRACARKLGLTPKELAARPVEEYYSIPIYYFLSLQHCPCEVFVRQREGNKYEYHKLWQKSDSIDLNKVQQLMKEGMKNLYVLKDQRVKFAQEVTTALTAKLSQPDLAEEERLELTSQSMEVVKEQLMSTGLTQELTELTWSSIDSLKILVDSHSHLKKLLERLMSKPHSFAFRHCQLVTYITFFALKKLQWSTIDQQKNLSFIAFFHDICLTNDEMTMITDEKQLRKSNTLSEKEKDWVRRHALNATKLIQNFPKAPLGVDTIIKQHHGSTSGIGFPYIPSSSISPMAVLFMIAEEIAHQILLKEPANSLDKSVLLEQLSKKYPRPMFRKIIDSLSDLEF